MISAAARHGRIVGGAVLLADGLSTGGGLSSGGDLWWSDGRIVADGPSVGDGAGAEIDAAGCLVLPGIVDLHGDAFERCLMPRGGVQFDVDLALQENDTQLVANGITTSFLSATDSWEPGLRSRQTLHDLVDALRRRRGVNDVLLHVRHERCNTGGLEQLEEWIEAGVIRFFSYNDHTPGAMMRRTGVSPTQVERAAVGLEELEDLQHAAVATRPIGLLQESHLAAVAAVAGCPTASHDPSTEEDLKRDLGLGVAVAEFPASIELANAYLAEGVDVLLGAPNLVRGGSHLGNLSVRDALEHRAGNLLCSDYHYPSLLQAPFVMAERAICDLATAWAMVSSSPARAAGLGDRGRLEPGARADVIVVEPPRHGRPALVRAVVAAGVVAARTA